MFENKGQKKGDAANFAEHLAPASLLSVEGQILFLLSKSERTASEVYDHVAASQPTVSKRLARMLQIGLIDVAPSSTDRRIAIYRMTDACRKALSRGSYGSILGSDDATPLHKALPKAK